MSCQEALQQDFFIYVSSLRDGTVTMHTNLPPEPDDWVKIPIGDQLVVYARMLDKIEQAKARASAHWSSFFNKVI